MNIPSIRIVMPLFFNGHHKLPLSAKNLSITEIDRYIARDLNKLWHSRLPIYKTGFCLNSTISYGAVFDNVFYAVAIWTNPVAANLPQNEWLELRRLSISPDAPKFTATYMLGKMVKDIKNRFKKITTLVSYQDTKVHSGTIYKAANWENDKTHSGGSWNRPNSKNLNGKPRTRPDYNDAIGEKKRWVYYLHQK